MSKDKFWFANAEVFVEGGEEPVVKQRQKLNGKKDMMTVQLTLMNNGKPVVISTHIRLTKEKEDQW